MKRVDKATVAVGVAACAACCAAPIAGVLTAIGLGTLALTLWIGLAGLIAGLAALTIIVVRRRRRRAPAAEPAPVQISVPSGR